MSKSHNFKKSNKSILIHEIILIPICIMVGYIFSSLQHYNEVNYVEISTFFSTYLARHANNQHVIVHNHDYNILL